MFWGKQVHSSFMSIEQAGQPLEDGVVQPTGFQFLRQFPTHFGQGLEQLRPALGLVLGMQGLLEQAGIV